MNFDRIPAEMRNAKQWICHKDKIPKSPLYNGNAKPTDPETWGSFEQAIAAVSKYGYSGLGFVFTADSPFCGIDIDHCINSDTGEISDKAIEIIEQMGSYAEISPSGTGIHIIYKGKNHSEWRCKKQDALGGGVHLEMYQEGRYFTVTGNQYGNTTEIQEGERAAAAIQARYMTQETPKNSTPEIPKKQDYTGRMDFDRAKEEIKARLPEYAAAELTRSKGKDKYVCPFCDSGMKANGTGALTIYENHYFCFSCQRKGDIFDLMQKIEGIDKRKVVQYAADKYGITINGNSRKSDYSVTVGENKPTKSDTGNQTGSTKKEGIDYTAYYRECNRRLQDTDYHRGITLETLNRFMVGYDPEWKHPKAPQTVLPAPRLIIPTSKTSYFVRDTRKASEITEGQDYTKQKVKADNWHMLNEKAISNAPVLYIVEGEIDALSIIDVGGNAVGLGGTSNINLFFKVLDHSEKAKEQKFIISLDNDKAGEEAKPALIEGFNKRGIAFCVYNPSGKHKDSNEALNADRAGFTQSVLYGMEDIDKLIQEYGEQERLEYQQTYCADSLFDDFISGIAANVNTDAVPTGFETLDSVLDGGLYEGLYGIGAISSLGKTTFVLQIADRIAAKGHQVLIFSLEMSKNELMAKSVSRNTIQRVMATDGDVKNAKTTRGILTGKRYPLYNQAERDLIKCAMQDYKDISKNIFIREGMGDVRAETIVEQVKEHINKGNKPPVVIVDYLQILAPHNEKATDKTNTDYAILTLKRLSRDYKIPVIVISSFNRENYKNKVSMQSFKESGAIEYSSDVLIGLQLEGAGMDDFDVDKAKRENPRKIEAVILKNRNGKTGDTITYNFYAMFNYFDEKGISTRQDTDTNYTVVRAHKRRKKAADSEDDDLL